MADYSLAMHLNHESINGTLLDFRILYEPVRPM